MAIWNITAPSGSGVGGTGSNTSAITVPGDFDGATIDSVVLIGTPTITGNENSNDDFWIRWYIANTAGTDVYGGDGADADSIVYHSQGDFSTTPANLSTGGAPTPAPTTAVSADWDDLKWNYAYTASGKNDASTVSWDSFTIRVTYTPATSSTPLTGGAGTQSYSFSGADVGTLYSEVLTSGAAAASYSFSGADTTTSSIEYSEGFEFDSFDEDAFASTAFDLEAGVGGGTTPLTGGAATASYSFAGADASTLYNEYLAAATDSYTFAGADVAYLIDEVTVAGVDSYTLTGADVTYLIDKAMPAAATSYTFAGTDISTAKTTITAAATGTYSLTGIDVTTLVNELAAAGTSSYSLSGADVTTAKTTVTAAAVGTYTFTGADVTYLLDEVMPAATAAYALTGADATTTTNIVLTAGVDTYTFSGADAGTEYHPLTAAATATYTFTGADVATTTDILSEAGTGAYSLTGADANTEYHQVSAAGVGTYALTGADVTTSKAITITAGTTSYTFTGIDVTTVIDVSMQAATGSYSLLYTDTGTLYNEYTTAGVGSYTLFGISADTSKAGTAAAFAFESFDSANAFDTNAFFIDVSATELDADTAAYTFTGADVSTFDNELTSAGTATYTFTGADVTYLLDTVIPADAGTYALSGADTAFLLGTILTADASSYTFTGIEVNIDQTDVAGVAAYTIDGRPIGTVSSEVLSFDYLAFSTDSFWTDAFSVSDLLGDQNITAEVITYSLTYADAATIAPSSDILSAARGDFSITAADAALYPATGMTAITLTVDWIDLDTDSPFYGVPALSELVAGDIIVFDSTTTPDSHAVTMSSTGLFNVAGTVLGNETFDYFIVDVSQSGTSAGTTEQISVLGSEITTAGVATYSFTGADITTTPTTILDSATYTFTGADVEFDVQGVQGIDAGTSAYTLTGTIALTYVPLDALTAAYTLTGADVTTTKDFVVSAGVGTYLLDGNSTRTIDPLTDDWIRDELITNVWIEAASTSSAWTPDTAITATWSPDTAAATPTWTSGPATTTTWTEKDVPD